MLLNIFVFPSSRTLWRLHFVVTQGPLLWAIPTWRNSFVFHSLDKVTSVFLHSLGALLTYVKRWEEVCCAGHGSLPTVPHPPALCPDGGPGPCEREAPCPVRGLGVSTGFRRPKSTSCRINVGSLEQCSGDGPTRPTSGRS